MRFHSEHLSHRRGPPQLTHALCRGPHDQAAHFIPTGLASRLLLQRLIEFDAVLVDAGQTVGCAKLSHQSSRVPTRSARQFSLLQEHHTLQAQLAEVVGQAVSDRSSTHDDSARRARDVRSQILSFRHAVAFLPTIKSRATTGQTFTRPAEFCPETYARQAFGIVGGEEPIKVRLLFEPKLAVYITERQWYPSQKFRARPEGRVEMRLETTGRKELVRWILSWMPDVKVLDPKSLRDPIAEKLRDGLRAQQ